MNMRNTELTADNLITYKVEVNSAQIGSSNIITIYCRSGIDVEFLEKIRDPIEFCSGSGNGTVFSFSCRPGDCLLLLRTPTDWMSTKEDNIPRCGCSIIKVARPISIGKCMKTKWRVFTKKESMI
ncbi:unnamed protein product [Musa hybrid cultivar]